MSLDLALTNYNAQTKRYGFARGPAATGGDVVFDELQAYPVMTAAMCTRFAYWAARLLGSTLFTLQNLASGTPSQAVAVVQEALEALVQLNLIKARPSVSAQASRQFGQLLADITWTTPDGQRANRRVGGK